MFSDYDAPLTEAGEYTQKYHLLRDLFSRFKSKLCTKFKKGKKMAQWPDSLPDL